MGLSDGEEIMTLAFFILTQYRRDTDRQTDRHVAVAKTRKDHSVARVQHAAKGCAVCTYDYFSGLSQSVVLILIAVCINCLWLAFDKSFTSSCWVSQTMH